MFWVETCWVHNWSYLPHTLKCSWVHNWSYLPHILKCSWVHNYWSYLPRVLSVVGLTIGPGYLPHILSVVGFTIGPIYLYLTYKFSKVWFTIHWSYHTKLEQVVSYFKKIMCINIKSCFVVGMRCGQAKWSTLCCNIYDNIAFLVFSTP